MHRALGSIAEAEGRWAEAVRELREGDRRPDGPVDRCDTCLPLRLFELFARAGMPDSALAQYDAYRQTPRGARPHKGPDFLVSTPAMETLARLYEQKDDTARALSAWIDVTERWKNADPELQPRLAAARSRIEALAPVERQP